MATKKQIDAAQKLLAKENAKKRWAKVSKEDRKALMSELAKKRWGKVKDVDN